MAGSRKGSKNKLKIEHLEFMTRLIMDKEYRESLRKRILAGEAKELEKFFWEKSAGKATDKLELSGGGPLFQIISALAPREVEDKVED